MTAKFAGFFTLVVAGMIGLSCANASARLRGPGTHISSVNEDDRDVVQLVVLQAAKPHEGWKNPTPRPIKAAIRPRWRTSTRASYLPALDEVIENARSDLAEARKHQEGRSEIPKLIRELKVLTDLRARKTISTYNPQPLKPIGTYKWDPRIIVTERGGHMFATITPEDDRNLKGVGIFAEVDPPSYSPDGMTCVVKLGFPWSIHAGTEFCVLNRVSGKWTICYEDAIYFL